MRLIAHRANINGRIKEKENRLEQIKFCISSGYDVEIDINVFNDQIYLGHDDIQQKISIDFLIEIQDKAWIHCKNLYALNYFSKSKYKFNYFWHQEDKYTLTSKGFIWTYPGSELCAGCIAVMPELTIKKEQFKNLKKFKIFGVCTDYPNLFT